MTPLLLILACTAPGPSPSEAPTALDSGEEVTEVRLDAHGLHVGGELLGTSHELMADPTDGLFLPLVGALSDVERATIRVSGDTPWMAVRKLLNSARTAEVDEVRLGTPENLWREPRGTRSRWASPLCDAASVEVLGADVAWTLELHGAPTQMWVLGSARFRPIARIDGKEVPMDDLSARCWSRASCALLSGEARTACETSLASTAPAPARVDIAGRWGCLLPLARQPDDLARWTTELAALVESYGISPDDDVMLMPEAGVRFSAIAALFDAFTMRDQAPPTLGMPLVEGNDGAPLCDTVIRDRQAIDRALGTWFAAQLNEAAGP